MILNGFFKKYKTVDKTKNEVSFYIETNDGKDVFCIGNIPFFAEKEAISVDGYFDNDLNIFIVKNSF